MNPTVEAVKRNLDLTSSKPLKICTYEAFKKTIILGDIPAGERINEKEFSEQLNISRTPIRFALQELVKEQLVEHIPMVGIVVKGISMKDAYEIVKKNYGPKRAKNLFIENPKTLLENQYL